jgi:hypothetical protein
LGNQELGQYNVVLKDYAGEIQQQITDPSPRQSGHPKITNSQLSKENFKKKEKLVTGPDGGLTPGQTDRLTFCRNITLTSTLSSQQLLGELQREQKEKLFNCQ